MTMTCSQCWTSVPAGRDLCPRCGAKVTGAPPSLAGLAKNYPWVVVVLVLSGLLTLWLLTRRAPPPPEPIPEAIEPVAVEAPAAEPVEETPVFPALPAAEAPTPAAVEPARPTQEAVPLTQTEDGAWQGGAPLARPSGN